MPTSSYVHSLYMDMDVSIAAHPIRDLVFAIMTIISDRQSSPIIIDHHINQKDPSGLSRVGDLV